MASGDLGSLEPRRESLIATPGVPRTLFEEGSALEHDHAAHAWSVESLLTTACLRRTICAAAVRPIGSSWTTA